MAIRSRLWAALPLLLFLVVIAAGCGGGKKGASRGSHQYVVEAPPQKGAPGGIYVTVISPVRLPTKLLTRKGARLVAQAKGPQACSAAKTLQGGRGKESVLNGKTVTFKVNGSGPLLSVICAILKKGTVNLPQLAGA